MYGQDGKFRRFQEATGQPHVLAVPSDQPLINGRVRSTVEAIAAAFKARVWQRASAGAGSKGPREYDWAVRPFDPVDERGWQL